MAVGVGWGKDSRRHELPDNLKTKKTIYYNGKEKHRHSKSD